MIDLTETLVEYINQDRRTKKVGRYNVSDFWAITNGYLAPEQYTEIEILTFINAFRIWQGITKHEQIAPLLEAKGYKTEVKKEYERDGITLVGKVDGIGKEIIEVKTSASLMDKAKRWHEYQVKCYLTMFEKDEGLVVQPAYNNNRLFLKVLSKVKRNDRWFDQQWKKLLEFHKLCQEQQSHQEQK